MAVAFMGYVAQYIYSFNLTGTGQFAAHSLSFLPIACSPRLSAILSSKSIVPVAVYEDLHLEGAKSKASNDLRGLSAVYAVENLNTGAMYVGSAITNRIANRLHKHLFTFLSSPYLSASLARHGLANFAFILLEVMPGIVDSRGPSNTHLLERETFYITSLNASYNIAQQGGNTLGVKHTLSTRQTMKENYSDGRRKQIGDLNRGRTFTPSTLEAMRLAALNRPPFSDETRSKLSSILSKEVTVSDLDGSNVHTFKNISFATGYMKCHEKTIRRALATVKAGEFAVVKGSFLVSRKGKLNK